MRMLLLELNRIHSHLVWLGTSALELGAISMFWYAFREREQILDLFELVARLPDAHAVLPGRRPGRGHPARLLSRGRKFVEWMPSAIDEYETLLTRNQIWLERTEGIGLLSTDDAIALGQSGPVLRGSGVDWDLRKAEPYLAYHQVDFDVPAFRKATSRRATTSTWRRCGSRRGSSTSA